MKYTLVNPNYTENYIENLISYRGGDIHKLESCSIENSLESPSLLDNIEAAAELLLNSINRLDKKICLIVDCDVDGYTSSTILYKYIKSINNNVEIDFLIRKGKKICPVEVKSGEFRKHTSLDRVSEKYGNKIGKRGLQKVWWFETWKNIHPEYHTEENKYWHSHNAKGDIK